MIVRESIIETDFIFREGVDRTIEYALTFMKSDFVLFQPCDKPEIHKVVGFTDDNGHVDIIIDMTGSLAIDYNSVYNAVNDNIELNNHVAYCGCRIMSLEDKISARIYYRL
jgi:hypothetical protein